MTKYFPSASGQCPFIFNCLRMPLSGSLSIAESGPSITTWTTSSPHSPIDAHTTFTPSLPFAPLYASPRTNTKDPPPASNTWASYWTPPCPPTSRQTAGNPWLPRYLGRSPQLLQTGTLLPYRYPQLCRQGRPSW